MEKTFRNKDGKIAGHLVDGVYRKNVERSKHLMKMCNGYGIDSATVDELKESGCTDIIINEMDTGEILTVSFADFEKNNFSKDFGHGIQKFISGKHLKSGR